MRKLLFLFFLITSTFASTLSFGAKTRGDYTPVYTIQLFSAKKIATINNAMKKIPKELKDETYIYKVGNYFAIRYAQKGSYKEVQPYVEIFQNSGFRDAYVQKTTRQHILDNKIGKMVPMSQTQKSQGHDKKSLQKQTSKKDARSTNTPMTTTSTRPTVSKFVNSNMVLKADNAYKSGNESEAMMYYEMLLASGNTNQKVKNNLCYLYGKRGAWFEAKTVIDKEQYQGKLLYSYAYGAVENNQQDYYLNLSPYIMLDRTGMLMLLTGSYFEKREDLERATTFYKMAYKKNKSNPYVLYSYARSEDIQKNFKQAQELYKKVLKSVNSAHPLYNATQQRIIQLGDL